MKQVILVTGASSGIGKATALKLIREGHIVYGAARRVDKMKDLQEAGGKILALDITQDEQVKKTVQQIIEEQGRIDVLVNNAGYAIYGSVEETAIEDARRQFEVNIFGLAKITQMVIPHMRKQGSGKIINMSSMGGKIYTPMGAWYHASKHALEGWSDSLRLELAPFGIQVVIIEPGIITTEFGDVMYQSMLDRSGKGPYKSIVDAVAKSSKELYGNPKAGSPPSVIADVIAKAIRAKKPKTRYAKGKMAGMLLFSRKLLSDKAFDKAVMSQVK